MKGGLDPINPRPQHEKSQKSRSIFQKSQKFGIDKGSFTISLGRRVGDFEGKGTYFWHVAEEKGPRALTIGIANI